MATSAFKSTTKRTSIGTNSMNGDYGSSTRAHRRSRSLSQFSRRPKPAPDFGDDPATNEKMMNTGRGSGFPEISLDDLAIELFSTKVYLDEASSNRRRLSPRTSNTTMASSQRRGRSVSRRSSDSDNGNSRVDDSGGGVVPDSSSTRRRSVSVARCRTSDCERDADHIWTSSRHGYSKTLYSKNGEMDLLQKSQPSVSRRRERSVSHIDVPKSHDDHSSHSSTVTEDEMVDAHHGKDGIEKIMEAVFARKKADHPVSHKDVTKSHDDQSSPSSTITEDETVDAHFAKNGTEKIMETVFTRKKFTLQADHPIGEDVNSGLYEAMRSELRYAVEEIRTELEQAMVGKNPCPSDDIFKPEKSCALRAFSAITKSYATKLEKSEKRKQDLLAEMDLEEQRGKELSEKVRELLPNTKKSLVAQKAPLTRKRSNDKNRMSKQLSEEAGKYFEDFISNVEDTDISSFDGERSDASSSLRGTKSRVSSTQSADKESDQSPAFLYNPLPVEMDGINFPWLKWDTADDEGTSKNRANLPMIPKSLSGDAPQESIIKDPSNQSTSSGRGSCSPGFLDRDSITQREAGGSKVSGKSLSFDMEQYVNLERDEQILFESWTERHRISSGQLLICHSSLF